MTLVPFIENTDSCKKALSLLDSATHADSTCFLCYHNKLMFLFQLNRTKEALATINGLIRLRPMAHDLYMTGGSFLERSGDSIRARPYFEKSLSLCNQALDTMQESNRDYDLLLLDKGLNLIMLGRNNEGNLLLTKLYNKQPASILKSFALSVINKSKKDILTELSRNSDVDSSTERTSE